MLAGLYASADASVLVGIRQDDESSQAVVREFATRLPVRAIQANGVGVIGLNILMGSS